MSSSEEKDGVFGDFLCLTLFDTLIREFSTKKKDWGFYPVGIWGRERPSAVIYHLAWRLLG